MVTKLGRRMNEHSENFKKEKIYKSAKEKSQS